MGRASNEPILAIATKTMTELFFFFCPRNFGGTTLKTLKLSKLYALLLYSSPSSYSSVARFFRTHPRARKPWRLVSKEGRTKRASSRRIEGFREDSSRNEGSTFDGRRTPQNVNHSTDDYGEIGEKISRD